jgi:predicted enzyme related to lactoylglutathione lyase
MGEGQYWIIQSGDEMVGGLTGLGGSDIKTDRSYWLTSMEVDDVDASWATALAAGAQGVMSPQDVPEVGRVAVLIDPTGIPFGIMKGLQPME